MKILMIVLFIGLVILVIGMQLNKHSGNKNEMEEHLENGDITQEAYNELFNIKS